MNDLAWLAQEAHDIHNYFTALFYLLITVFLLLGVLLEYFKLPLGHVPSFGTLVGRALIAVILLISFTTVVDTISEVSTAVSAKLGEPNQFALVRERMGERLSEFAWSWTKIKDSITVAMCYISFVFFHFSIYIADAFFYYTWTLLYIFAPVLIALYVMPATSGATAALYRSLIEVACWKPVWMATATLLWSTALGDLNQTSTQVSFLTVICYCLVLSGSLLLTPFVVHALAKSGLTALAKNVGAVTVGATAIGPTQVVRASTKLTKGSYNLGLAGVERATKKFPKVHRAIEKMPRFRIQRKPHI